MAKAFNVPHVTELNAFHNDQLAPTGTDGARPGEIEL
jgi:hypothetical protein